MIPVVFIHQHGTKDDHYNLDLVARHAERFNPRNVVLMTNGYGAEWAIEDYNARAQEFAEYYMHLSSNHRLFELFCIQRWFILHSWMEHNSVDKVLYADSDVLIYTDVSAAFKPYQDCALTLCLGTSPATSYFTHDGLGAFLDFVESVYLGRNWILEDFQRIFREMREQNLPGGVCDMTLFKYFKQEVRHIRVGEMTEIHDGSTWDHNINSSDGYVMNGGHKDIEFHEHRPHCKLLSGEVVEFNSLHFQGGAKKSLVEIARKVVQ